ncbi:MAG: polysaccharide deacetylase family protein [Prolixibacteraceae bacterium]|nr:polysaccharide deacetylase family protein [Prolixibacteraceae bacterium]
MVLFYTDELNPRIEYIVRLIFEDILKTEVSFTNNAAEFIASEMPGFNYSGQKFGNEFYIKPHPLMYSKSLIKPDLTPVWYKGEKYFFESSPTSDLPFDPLAASFYLVTRYEEYINPVRDKYNRFPAHESVLYKFGLLKRPVVNIWAQILAEGLADRYPGISFPATKFEFISTIDIDNAWAFSHKGFWRTAGAIAKAAIKGDISELKQRILVLTNRMEDPFYNYSFIDEVVSGNENRVIYFFLLGNYGHYDKNISWRNRHFQNLINRIAKKYGAGIHFSFYSGIHKGENRLLTECKRLEKITGRPVVKSRQHFLLLNFPSTFQKLINAGIKEDYTMGFASGTGFRAGICAPYYFYDLGRELVTGLKIIPFQVMDTTLQVYMGLSAEEAEREIKLLMEEVKKVGGMFVSLWHNESLCEQGPWKGYRDIFESMNKTGFKWANE